MRYKGLTRLAALLWLGACNGQIGGDGSPGPHPRPRPPLSARDPSPPFDPGVIPLPAPQHSGGGSVDVPLFKKPVFADLSSTPKPPPALSGGTLRVLRGGTLAVAADPDRDRIYVADLTAGVLVRDLALSPGDEPGRVLEDAGGRVHVVLRRSGAIATLAAGTYDLADRRAVCPAPRGIAASAELLFVACAGGELVALPAAGGPALWTRQLPRDLRDVVVDGDRLLVSRFRAARLLVVDLGGQLLDEAGPPVSLNLTRRENAGATGPARTRFTPAVAWRTVPLPGGGAVMLHQRGFTGEVVADSQQQSGGYGSRGCGGGIVQTVVSRVQPGQVNKPSPELAGVVLALDLALSADARSVALVSPADAHTPALGSLIVVGLLDTVVTMSDVGCVSGPSFLGPLPTPGAPPVEQPWREGESPFQHNRLLGQAVAVDFDGQNDVVVQMREPAAIRVPRRQLTIPLSAVGRADLGQAIFHANTGVGIACASCHPDGAEDGLVWTFAGLGPRRTQSLRGGVSQTLPLHWDGDMADMAAIAREVFTGRMAGQLLDDDKVAALAGYIDSLPLLSHAPATDVAAIERGRALFNDQAVGCATCHAGPRLTDNSTRDVGTGRRLQVPSLLGIGDRAPFMHTGCAPDLLARFSAECGGGDRHGVTSRLTADQQVDLRAYLESL